MLLVHYAQKRPRQQGQEEKYHQGESRPVPPRAEKKMTGDFSTEPEMNSSAEGKRSQEEEKNLTEENHRGAHEEMNH